MAIEDDARQKLLDEWNLVSRGAAPPTRDVPPAIIAAIGRSINSKTKTYRYVLPTQLSAKAADLNLDARSIQAGWAMAGAFDARSVAQNVVVAFDRDNHNVLGGSAEPYANNPVRIPAFVVEERAAQKDKAGFNDLVEVLAYAQRNPAHVEELLRATLTAVHRRLASAHVTYPVPNRASLAATLEIVGAYLRERSGGVRMQAVAVALLQTIGTTFRLFDAVVSHNIDAADASTGSAADLECVHANGEIFSACEVKDRPLALRHIQDKLPPIRQKGIREVVFLVQGGIADKDKADIETLVGKEFATGQNIYVAEFSEFFRTTMIQVGETGRRRFMVNVGDELDQRKADIPHRAQWARLLAET